MSADLRQDAVQVLNRIRSQFDSALGTLDQADASASPSPDAVSRQIGNLSDSLRRLLSRKLAGSLEADEVGQISERMKALQATIDGFPSSDPVTLDLKGRVVQLRGIFLQVQNARVDAAKGGVSLLESSAQRGPVAPVAPVEQPHGAQLPSTALAKGMLARFVAQWNRAVTTEGDDQRIVDGCRSIRVTKAQVEPQQYQAHAASGVFAGTTLVHK